MLHTQDNHTVFIISAFNAGMFGAGEVVNGTGGYINNSTGAIDEYGAGGGLSAGNKEYYHKTLIDVAEPELVHAQFGQKRPIPEGNGKTVEFRKYSSLPKLTEPLVEGVTPKGQKMSVTVVKDTPSQYGGYTELSDMLTVTNIDPIIIEATKMIGSQAGRTLDGIVAEKINAGTQVQYAEGKKAARNLLVGGNADESLNDYLTVEAIRMAVRTLKSQNARKINGNYVAIIHPNVSHDLMNDPTGETLRFTRTQRAFIEVKSEELPEFVLLRHRKRRYSKKQERTAETFIQRLLLPTVHTA